MEWNFSGMGREECSYQGENLHVQGHRVMKEQSVGYILETAGSFMLVKRGLESKG